MTNCWVTQKFYTDAHGQEKRGVLNLRRCHPLGVMISSPRLLVFCSSQSPYIVLVQEKEKQTLLGNIFRLPI